MSIWDDHDVEGKIVQVLTDLPVGASHHFGRPYITVYQLAIAVHRRWPEVAADLGYTLGGSGTGAQNSLTQYLGKQLSDHIRDHAETFPVEGAFLTHEDLVNLAFSDNNGDVVTSSVTGSGYDLSMYRLRG